MDSFHITLFHGRFPEAIGHISAALDAGITHSSLSTAHLLLSVPGHSCFLCLETVEENSILPLARTSLRIPVPQSKHVSDLYLLGQPVPL